MAEREYMSIGHLELKQRLTGDGFHHSMLGPNVVTVNEKLVRNSEKTAQFRYLEDALDYIKDNSEPVSVKGNMDGTITATQYSDAITLQGSTVNWGGSSLPDPEWAQNAFIDAGLVNTNLFRRSFFEINDDGIYRPIDGLTNATTLRTVAGYEGATTAGLTWDVYEIPHYTIMMYPGRQRMSRAHGVFDCGPVMNVDIIGAGSGVSWYEALGQNKIDVSISGHFGIENMSINFATSTIPFEGISAAHKVGLDFSIINTTVLHMDPSVGTDVINVSSARLAIDNLRCKSRGDTFVFSADEVIVRNLHLLTPSGSSNRLDFRFDVMQRTKDAFITNIQSTQGGGTPNSIDIEEFGGTGGAAVKQVYMKDIYIPDGDIELVSPNGKVAMHIGDSILEAIEAGAGSTLNHGNVRPLTGILATNGTGTFTIF